MYELINRDTKSRVENYCKKNAFIPPPLQKHTNQFNMTLVQRHYCLKLAKETSLRACAGSHLIWLFLDPKPLDMGIQQQG